jgi:uncharacterized protein
MIYSVIIKVASNCNLSCSYCYVSRNKSIYNNDQIISSDILFQLITKVADYCEYHDLKDFAFCWHGGEPLLAGYDFFEEIISLQKKYMPKVSIDNYIQTNGLLLNERWIEIFKKHNYYVAISIDGPKHINDIRRKTKNGGGTHDLIVEKINLLNKHNFPVKILSVITPEALPFGKEIYRYYRSLNCNWMDFLYPICNRIDSTFEMKVSPSALGEFLCDVYDEWLKEDNPNVYIRSFHDFCMLLMKGTPITCHMRNDCSFVVTLNSNGKIYICDDLLAYADSYLGDIFSDSFVSIETNKRLLNLSSRASLFCDECLTCEYFPVCNGGCTLFRVKEKDNFLAKNYYCYSQKMIINHIRNSIFENIADT